MFPLTHCLLLTFTVLALAANASAPANAATRNDQYGVQPYYTAAQAPDARLVALVQPGAITRSKGVQTFSHPSTGQYCFKPTAAAGLHVGAIVPAVSVDWSTSTGSSLLAFYRSSGDGCPSGNIEVVTYVFSAGADPALSDSVGFTLLVP